MNVIDLNEIRASTSQILNAASDEILQIKPKEIAGGYLILAANGMLALVLMLSPPTFMDIFLALALVAGIFGLSLVDRTCHLAK